MIRNQKIHLDANPAVACIRRDRPSRHEHPRGPADPDPDPDPDPVRSSLPMLGACFKAGRRA